MQTVANLLEVVRAWMRRLGPYVLLEMLLPGGTLFALLLFLYRRVFNDTATTETTGISP